MDDDNDAHFTAAHEYGHIAAGHTSGRRTGGLVGIYAGTVAGAMTVSIAVAYLVGGADLALVGLFAGALAWLPLQRHLTLRLKRPMEHAADLYAARVGAPLTAALVHRYERQRTSTGRILRYLFPIHASWAERLAVTQAAFPDTSSA